METRRAANACVEPLSTDTDARIHLGGGAMADTVIVYKASPAIRDLEVDLGRYMDPRVAAAVDAANASRRFLISPPLGAWPLPGWPAPAGRAAAASVWVHSPRSSGVGGSPFWMTS